MKRIKKLVAFAVVVTMVAVMGITAAADALDDANARKAEMRSQYNLTQGEIDELDRIRTQLNSYVEEMDTQLNEVSGRLYSLQAQIDEKQSLIDQANESIAAALASQGDQKELMRRRVKYIYEHGNQSLISELLESGSITQFINRLQYAQTMADYDKKIFDDYSSLIASISENKALVEKETAELLPMRDQAANEEAELYGLLSEKENEVSGYSSEIASKEAQLAVYQAEIDAQNEIIARIQAAMAGGAEEYQGGTGVFVWPCPACHTLSEDYGWREIPIEGASSFHNGIDIAAYYGDEIVAASDGNVLISGWSSSAGNWIVISHGGGVCSVYMHASALLCSVGDYVSAGQTIGLVGSTGMSTGPHLHFGVSVDGEYVSPWNYL